MTTFDLFILTVRDQAQADCVEERLKSIPLPLPVHILADLPGPAPGSGGATLRALAAARQCVGTSARVLIIHDGGFATRLPEAGDAGKALVEVGGRTVLEGLLETFLPWASHLPPGVLISCGDIEYSAPPPLLPDPCDFAAWVYTATPATCSRHGAYAWDGCRRLTHTWQKPQAEELPPWGFGLDTGVLWCSADACTELLRVSELKPYYLPSEQSDLYGDLVPILALADHAYALQPAGAKWRHLGTSAELVQARTA